MTVPVICIDGPVGSGKGTIASLVAQRLGFNLLDSGALYRLTALAAVNHGVALDNEAALEVLAAHLDVQFELGAPGDPARIILEGEPVDKVIRSETCGGNASKIAGFVGVRAALLERQRAFAEAPGLVADGRDMGTVVFPAADLKIFLVASAEERARRRFEQLKAKGLDANLSHLLDEIRQRDERDMNRAIAPLKPADDAIVLDSTKLSIEEVLDRVLALADEQGVI